MNILPVISPKSDGECVPYLISLQQAAPIDITNCCTWTLIAAPRSPAQAVHAGIPAAAAPATASTAGRKNDPGCRRHRRNTLRRLPWRRLRRRIGNAQLAFCVLATAAFQRADPLGVPA